MHKKPVLDGRFFYGRDLTHHSSRREYLYKSMFLYKYLSNALTHNHGAEQ